MGIAMSEQAFAVVCIEVCLVLFALCDVLSRQLKERERRR
jgi:hypothetical protein